MPKKSFLSLLILVLLFPFTAIGWQLFKSPGHEYLPRGTVTIRQATFDVEIASTREAMRQGLSGRASLGRHEGMYFIYPTHGMSFWMKDMKFPLDIIWIRDNVVLDIAANVPAPAPNTPPEKLKNYISPPDANRVLEVNAGTAVMYQIKPGDLVVFKGPGT